MNTRQLILFYDIDGCFHPHGVAKFNDQGKVHRAPDDGLFIWADLIAPLMEEFPNLQLVCHSTWRNLYDLEELKQQVPGVLAERTIGCTQPYMDRHKSIIEYAHNHNYTDYVILDDDPWAFPSRLNGLVIVPSDKGLSEPSALEALRTAILLLTQDTRVAFGPV